jgi:NADPH:quinone reductase-like Zn-dependent oxidoreductase
MKQKKMRAIQMHRYGGAEELQFEEVPVPEPLAGEVLVRVHTTSVLPVEWKIRQGLFQKFMPLTFPVIPGSAFAGVIEQVGADVTAFKPGQAVFGRSNRGTYADYTTALPETLALKPEALNFDEVATISGGATTAWTALFENGRLQEGQRVLIHGAAGGVGLFAVQFARWKGAQVIGTASTSNLDFVRSLGAQIVIDYTRTPFEQVVQDVDLVLETIGGEYLQRSMQVIKRGGTLISLLEQPHQEEAKQRGIRALKNTATPPFPSQALLSTIAQLMVERKVHAIVGKIFQLDEARLAQDLSQRGHGRGRIVLHCAG